MQLHWKQKLLSWLSQPWHLAASSGVPTGNGRRLKPVRKHTHTVVSKLQRILTFQSDLKQMCKQESLISEGQIIALGYLADIKAMAVGRVTKFPQ